MPPISPRISQRDSQQDSQQVILAIPCSPRVPRHVLNVGIAMIKKVIYTVFATNFVFFPPLLTMAATSDGIYYCPHHRAIAEKTLDGDWKDALLLSEKCEDAYTQHNENPFKESMLRGQYFASTQLLVLLNRYDEARVKKSKGAVLAKSDLILDWENQTDGFLLEKGGDLEGAMAKYETSSPFALGRLAMIFMLQGEISKARATAQKVIESNPENLTAQVVLAAVIESTNEQEALCLYSRALNQAKTKVNKGVFSSQAIPYVEGVRAKVAITRLNSNAKMRNCSSRQ